MAELLERERKKYRGMFERMAQDQEQPQMETA
jgi:hypothetical protein